MKVGLVTNWFPSGAGYVSKAYADVISAQCEVFIYARAVKSMKGDQNWDTEKVTWGKSAFHGFNTNHFIVWAKRSKLDVIIFNEQRYWEPVLRAKKNGFCVGAYVDYYKSDTVSAFGLYDFLLCNTARHYSVFRWHKGAHYIKWGTDINRYKPRHYKKKLRTFMISAGWEAATEGDRRGSLLALKAFKEVKGECRLLVYSQIRFDECREEWQRAIKSDSRVEFVYGSPDPFPYEQADVFLYPSRLDGIGLTMPEAISSGLPVVATDNAPMNEFVKDGINGILVKVESYTGRKDGYYWAQSICDLSSLRAAIQYFVELDTESLTEMKIRSRKFAENNLDWHKNAKNLVSLLQIEHNKSYNSKNKITKEQENTIRSLDRRYSPTICDSLLLLCKNVFIYVKRKIKYVWNSRNIRVQ